MAKNPKQTTKAATPRAKASAAPQYGLVAAANNPKMYTPYLQVGSYLGPMGKIIHNPDPTLKLTQTRMRGQMAYQDMLDKDPHLAGLFETRFESVVSSPREILPADDSAETSAMAETVARVVDGIDEFEDSEEDLLGSRINGFRVAEVEWERWSDGTLGIKKLHSVPSDAILFDIDGNTRLRTTPNMAEGELVPDRKFVVMRHKATSMNPYGVGLGRSLWWYSWFKREALKFWLVFVEKFGQPTVMGKHPAQWNEIQQDELLEILRNIASESALRIPSDVEVELLEATRSGNVTSYESLCKWIDDAMSKRVLGQ